jgi:diguanylate cyclase (GGDEF)-like protein
MEVPAEATGAVEMHDNALRFMRRVRWMAVPFTVLQFALYTAPAGLQVPFDTVRTGWLIAGLIAVANVTISVLAARATPDQKRLLVLAGLAIDAVIVVTMVWLFRFDGSVALWALLVIPVLEAALAAQMVGALTMWTVLTGVYIAREFSASANYGYLPFEAESISFRMGIVLIVAVTVGSLARHLTRQVAAERLANGQLEQRAALLHGLAVSSRGLFATEAADDVESIWDAIVQCAMDVGFEGASICVFDPDGDSYRVACARGLPDGYVGSRHAAGQGLAGMVTAAAQTIVVEDYSALQHPVPALKATDFGAAIGVPIRRFEGGMHAVLIAGYHRRGALAAAEVEYIELLAVHAGVAVSNVERMAERARHGQQLHALAYTDSLTGLPNRESFVAALNEVMAGGDARGTVTVLFFDVDRFKTVNDSLGHSGGDDVLRAMAGRIAACIRPDDILARLSGDEFALLLHDTTHDAVEHVVGAILEQLSAPLDVVGAEIVVTASIGVAAAGGADGVAPSELLSRADTAMYAAKRAGGGRHRWFGPELQENTARRLRIRTDLQRAVARGELEVEYQPVWQLTRHRVVGVEALLRWNHPAAGRIPPEEFIPIAEECGLIVDIGRWILREATQQLAQWERETGLSLQLGVNFSARQLAHPQLLGDIVQALSDAGVPPGRMVVEITESVMVDDVEHNAAVLTALHDQGIHLAVDDFGTGYSSLSYLRRFPVDIIKIDRSFVQLLDTDEESATLPRAILDLARTLGLDVCAEGIEAPAQLDALRRLGCVFGQGFLLGRPTSAGGFAALLHDQLVPQATVRA